MTDKTITPKNMQKIRFQVILDNLKDLSLGARIIKINTMISLWTYKRFRSMKENIW